MCTEFISRHILKLPPTKIFTTRELLRYGTRGAVDQALYRMVREGFIFRLARGVFVRDPRENPSRAQIAFAKARAWGKTLLTHADATLREYKIMPFGPFREVYAVDAHSGSFGTVQGQIFLKGIGIRKRQLCKSKVGQIVYALWHIGWKVCADIHVERGSARFNRVERQEFLDASAWMPKWLNNLCRERFPEPTLVFPE